MANISNSGLWCLCGYLADLGGRVDMSPVCWSQDPSTQGQWGSRYPAPWSPGSRKERISEHGLRFLSLDQLLAQVCTKKRPGSKQPMALWPKPCKSLVEKPRWLATPLTECHLKREGRYLPPCGALSALWGSEGRQQQTGGCRSPEAALRPFHEAVPIGHLRCQRMEDQCPGSLHGSSPVCPQEQEETLGSALQHLGSLAPAEGDQIWFWSEGKLLTDQRGQVNALAWGLALSEGGAAIQRSGHREGPGLLARPQGCAGLASETVSGAASLHTARRRRHLGLRCCSWCFYTRSCQRVISHRECWTEHPDWNVATTASACGPPVSKWG